MNPVEFQRILKLKNINSKQANVIFKLTRLFLANAGSCPGEMDGAPNGGSSGGTMLGRN